MAVGEAQCVQAGAGIRQVHGANRSPRHGVIARFGDTDAMERAVLAHVGHERTVLPLQDGRLDVAEAGEHAAGEPRLPGIVAEGHDGNAVGVRVERQHDAAGAEHSGFATRLPAETLGKFVGDGLPESFDSIGHHLGGHGRSL